MRFRRRHLLGGALALALTANGGAAKASPEDLFGYGGRTSAMGATGATHASGYEAAWHNPALASTARLNKLTFGYSGAVFQLEAPSGYVSAEPAKGILVGADIPIPLGGKLRDRIGVALAFYTPTDIIIRGRVLYPETPQFPLLADRAQSLAIRSALGVDVGWGIRAGVGLAALAELVGTVVAATDVTGRVGTRVENQLVATYAPSFGASWELPGTSHLRVGATFRGTLDARFAVVVDGTKLSSLAIPLLNISGLAQYDPAQGAIEVARVDELSVLALQLTYKRWSDYPGVLEPTIACGEGGPGSCGLTPPMIDWRDTVAVRLGAEEGFVLAPGVVLRGRGGAFVETSPLPASLPVSEAFDVPSKSTVTVPTRYFDATRIGVTAGLGLGLDRPLPPIDLDMYAQVHVLLPRTITSADGAGTELASGEASGRIKVFGMTAGVKF